ncbi:VCBS repeat-containing protein [Parafilimonas sp.]|uniref:VCBS repeat-containing protein n=1 Tax=Parafilimonas sp. TaxID=1969739 RepID=UPI0039E49DDE
MRYSYSQLFAALLLPVLIAILFTGCSSGSPDGDHTPGSKTEKPLFELLPAEKTQIIFNNRIEETLNMNLLMYEYYYNGGGVAVGDINGDGLDDIYFSGNVVDNRLYLNKGNMQFQDITAAANVAGRPGPWKTGVCMADINGDGRLDMYGCHSGMLPGVKRTDELFINDGNDAAGIPHFSEQAAKYGLADTGFSTQAFFFDYDRDGDLDMLLLHHNPKNLPVLNPDETNVLFNQPNDAIGLKLYKNDNNHFTDVTAAAKLNSSALSYGLGAGIADINGDGWPDMYISNDYGVPDFLYINNKNGTFTNELQNCFGHISQFSMGNAVADINNDALPDIFTLDMLPEDNRRQKLLFMPDNYEKFEVLLQSGFYYQYMRNMLQVNNGIAPSPFGEGRGEVSFSETGQIAGISNTDWSWAPLFADFDNDGWKDLFVTNGFLRDYTDLDFITYLNQVEQSGTRLSREDLLNMIGKMPSSSVVNYLFRNDGLIFSDVSKAWGINIPSNSNGAAYADLDNDGDLDLIVNNINQPAFIYSNTQNNDPNNHYLAIKLNGSGKNTAGIGAKLTTWCKGKKQYMEQQPSYGYQSSVSPVLHFGLGADTTVDSLRIVWQSGKQQVLTNIRYNQAITINEKDAKDMYHPPPAVKTVFTEVKPPIDYTDATPGINDFKRQPLLTNPLSFAGPCMAKADINNDGLEDVYIGGGNGQAGAIFMQQPNGTFNKTSQPALDADKQSTDADAVFFDANGDGFTDLYVAGGGYNDFTPDDILLLDRLYMNDGKGNFIKAADALPEMRVSKSCARVADVNGDGHPDIFVGGRVMPGNYPETPKSYLLINDGKGHFKDETASLAPGLQKAGMITDAAWADLNNDSRNDLIVIGEWMPVTIFINDNGKLVNKTKDYFEKEYSGLWNKLLVGDFNKDGKPDIIIANQGLNSQCKATDKAPAALYYKDFDGNGAVDPMLCFYIQGKSYPYMSRDELITQMPGMQKKFPDYKTYADATINDLFTKSELKNAGHLKVNYLKTVLFESSAGGRFRERELPLQAQYSPVFTITAFDYDKDGNEDILLCGNINHARLRFGKFDANYGVLLHNNGKGNFTYVPQNVSGFNIRGDVRSVTAINNTLIFALNQGAVKAYAITWPAH